MHHSPYLSSPSNSNSNTKRTSKFKGTNYKSLDRINSFKTTANKYMKSQECKLEADESCANDIHNCEIKSFLKSSGNLKCVPFNTFKSDNPLKAISKR